MIYVSENIFNELSNGKQKIFYSMVRIPTLQRLQRIVQERCALEIEERKQCETLWNAVYSEYRRIGYRLRTL